MKQTQTKLRRIEYSRGCCSARWICKNVNKKCCNPIPKPNEYHIVCKYFKREK